MSFEAIPEQALNPGIAAQFLQSNTTPLAAWVSFSGDFTVAVGGVATLATVTVPKGGTNITSYTAGDVLYATGSTTLAKRAIGSTGDVLTVSAGLPVWAPPATSGTVTSITLDTTASYLNVNGTTSATITTSGTFTLSTQSAIPHTFLAGPASGGAAGSAFRTLVPLDWVSGAATGALAYASSSTVNAWLAIGSTGNVLTIAGGVPTWAAPATSGTVTSVAMTVPTFLSVAGSPITSSGTLAVTLATQTANLAFMGPSSGSAATPTFRPHVPLDWAASAATGGLPYASSSTVNAWLAIGTTGQVLTVAGGVPTWATSTSAPGGATTNVQFNSSGAFSGDAGLVYLGQANAGTLLGIVPTNVAAEGVRVTAPASFAGYFFRSIDSSAADNFVALQAASGQTAVNIYNATGHAAGINAIMRMGPREYPGNGNTIANINIVQLKSGSAVNVAQIVASATEAQSVTALGTSLKFFVTKNTTIATTNAWLMDQNLDWVPNNTGAAANTTDTGLFQYFTTCAGPPTGVPTARTGAAAVRFDTTNGCFWVYSVALSGWFSYGPGRRHVSKTTGIYTMVPQDDVVDVSLAGGNQTTTLPLANSVPAWKIYNVFCTVGNAANTISIAKQGGDTINGAATTLTRIPAAVPQGWNLKSDGVSAWYATSDLPF